MGITSCSVQQMKKEPAAAAKPEDVGTLGAEVSVPFSWESQPGTPRVRLRETPLLPPLTPPPSYYYNMMSTPTRPIEKHSKRKLLLSSIFQRRSSVILPSSSSSPSPSPSSSSSSSSSHSRSQSWSSRPKSYSVPSSPMTKPNFRGYPSNPRQSYNKEDEEEYEPPVSALCFGNRTSTASSRGCWYSSLIKLVVH